MQADPSRQQEAMDCQTEQTCLDISDLCEAEEENAPRPDENCNRRHAGLSQIATQEASLTIELLGERELVLVRK
jgi:hypothetical protein